MLELARRAKRAKERLAEHRIPTAVQVTELSDGPQLRVEVEFKLGAVATIMLAELLADRLDEKRRAEEQATRQMATLQTDTMREA